MPGYEEFFLPFGFAPSAGPFGGGFIFAIDPLGALYPPRFSKGPGFAVVFFAFAIFTP